MLRRAICGYLPEAEIKILFNMRFSGLQCNNFVKSATESSRLRRQNGWVAEWSCSGLQLRSRRFDSDPSLHFVRYRSRTRAYKDLQIIFCPTLPYWILDELGVHIRGTTDGVIRGENPQS
jgi:hypothetical protein